VDDIKVKIDSLGSLCEAVAWANIQIYDLENKKWWNRKSGTATDADINRWDEVSRSWNEKRSLHKRQIDELLTTKLTGQPAERPITVASISFQVLPISLMIDMLTIECIKIFDLTKKGSESGVNMAKARKEALKNQIDAALEHIVRVGHYDVKGEARTF
jgi:hypothetical protein